MEEESVGTGDSIISCNLPFFTQELVLVDRKVLKNRVRQYNSEIKDPKHHIGRQEEDIAKSHICNFELVDGEARDGEYGLQCTGRSFYYSLGDMNPGHHSAMDHGKDEDGFALKTIAEYPIRVSGKGGEPITQLFKVTLGMEFAFSAGFRAVLRRVDGGVLSEQEGLHPFTCLLD